MRAKGLETIEAFVDASPSDLSPNPTDHLRVPFVVQLDIKVDVLAHLRSVGVRGLGFWGCRH